MPRDQAASGFPITNGARDMLSTPPAISREFSPVLMARAAMETASILEPQSRLTVVPDTDCGSPASSSAMRATLRLSSPAWLAQPRITSSTALQSMDGLRSISALTGMAARSSVRTGASEPP